MGALSDKMAKAGHLGGYIPGGDDGTWFPRLWTWAIRRFELTSVLDVGCGEGHTAKFFLDQGCDVLGIEGCAEAIRHSAIPGKIALHDFTTGPMRPGRTYDLIWSCEFLEHVEARYVPNMMETFAHAGKAIMITHALPGQPGHHHVNCRPNSYWVREIERLGFACHISDTLEARRASLPDNDVRINFFARSGLVFVRPEHQACRQESTGMWASAHALWRAKTTAWKINWQFFGSRAYRQHKRRCREARRELRRAG
jgi:SAM-dependent methyltransferase